MSGGTLQRLGEVLDELADVDVDSLGDGEVHELVVALGGLSSRLEAAWCRLVGVWDRRVLWAGDGSKAAGARLARETHWRRGDCDRVVRRGRDLATMPLTAAAYAAGEVCGAHVDLVASCDRPWRNAAFADCEALLVELCRTPFFTVAARGIEYWKLRADRDAADRDAEALRDGRHLAVSASWRGEIVIDGVLDPLGGETFKTELDRLCDQLRLHDLGDGVERTVQQRRADALVEMAMRSATAAADGLRPRPLLTVTIGIEPFRHLCQTAAGTVIAPGTLVPYLADADIERLVYDPPNRNISCSYRRRFPAALRRIIEIRDGHCQHPSGCDEPAARCDADHIVPISHGGITCLCNGQLLCAHHNRTIKNATDRTRRLPAPSPRTGDPLPCTANHESAWTAVEDDVADVAEARAPPTAG